MGSDSTDPEAVVSADKLDTEDVLVVVQLLEPLGASCGRQAGLDVDLPHAADLEVAPAQHAAADERLVPLRLVEAPDQRPNLRTRHYINQNSPRDENSYPSARRLIRPGRRRGIGTLNSSSTQMSTGQ